MLGEMEENYCNEVQIRSGEKNPKYQKNPPAERKEIIEERCNWVTKTEEGRKKSPW